MVTYASSLNLTTEKLETFSSDYLDKFNISLMNGLSGLGVAAAYLGRYHDGSFRTMADRCYGEIRQRLRTYSFRLGKLHTYCSGLAGVLFAFKHLEEQDFYPDPLSSGSLKVLIDTFITCCEKDFAERNVDFLHGPLGIFYALLKWWPHPEAERGMNFILDRYLQQLKQDDRGIRVFNGVIFNQHEAEYNFSLSHGMTGHLLILAEAYRRGYRREQLRPVLEGMVRYISAQARPAQTPGQTRYPSYFVEDEAFWQTERPEAFCTRLGWCYGDLNVAMAFMKVGDVLKDQDLKNHGVEVAANTVVRTDAEETQIGKNPYVCHGASGLALTYGILYERTRLPAFATAQEHWLGFTDRLLEEQLENYPALNVSLSLLEGLSGIALTLLSEKQRQTLPTAEFFLLNH
ncbi:MAG: lanthionine synthetase LanC family protein [Bacteroidota bacterium]